MWLDKEACASSSISAVDITRHKARDMMLPLTAAVIDGADNAVLRRRVVATTDGNGRAMVLLLAVEDSDGDGES